MVAWLGAGDTSGFSCAWTAKCYFNLELSSGVAHQLWESLPVHKLSSPRQLWPNSPGGHYRSTRVGFAAVSGRLRPSPAVSSRLRPSPAVSSLKGASGFPLIIVNRPFVNCKLDSSHLASKSDPLVFHWQSIGNWQLAAWLLGWGPETGGWGLETIGWRRVAGDRWIRFGSQLIRIQLIIDT